MPVSAYYGQGKGIKQVLIGTFDMTKDYCIETFLVEEQVETYDSLIPSCVMVRVTSDTYRHQILFRRSYFAPEQHHTFTTLLLQSMNYLYAKEKHKEKS